jgi:predicted AlkP superfamily phosphohydrolase/phosphomutase
MDKKMLVIGLDCVTPQLVYSRWLDDMPNIKRLMDGGISGNLVSTIPPITVPAWMSMMTSQDPGTLGIYGFRNRKSRDYEDLFVTSSNYIKATTVWNYLSRNRRRSLLLGVPLTYPPKPLNGVLVSSFLTPSKEVNFTYPADYKATLDKAAGGDYIIDVKDFRTTDKDWLLQQIYTMTERRFKAFRYMLENEEWDFAMMVEMGPDRLHHGFWRYTDSTHRLYEKGNAYEDTSVVVVSDHGAKSMKGGICINEWLIEQNLLTVKNYPEEPTRLRPTMIDWSKTQVWGEGGYYARIFINVEGREPYGTIPAAEYDSFRRQLKEKIEAITDDKGNLIGTKAYLPEEIYRHCKNIAPDLVVYLGNLDWRSAGTIGHRSIHIFENDTGPDDANHAQEGIFIWHDPKNPVKRMGEKVSIYDVAPSILNYYDLPIPDDMIGKPI